MESAHKNVLDALKKGQLDDKITSEIESVAKDLVAKYKSWFIMHDS